MAEGAPAIDTAALRSAFGSYMTGVTVVTCRRASGETVGFTANSFTSVSLEPPLLLVCPGRHLSSFDAFATTRTFAVSVLSEGQQPVANLFARKGADRFDEVAWRVDEHDCPLIDGAAATFSCHTHARIEAGDHAILVGRVQRFEHTVRAGLGYGRDGYFELTRERRSDANRTDRRNARAGVLLSTNGRIYLQDDGNGYHLPAVAVPDETGARSTLASFLHSLGVRARIGPVYSVFDAPEAGEHLTYFRAFADRVPDPLAERLVPLAATEGLAFARADERAIIERFRRETANARFGLYVGSSARGEVHHGTGD